MKLSLVVKINNENYKKVIPQLQSQDYKGCEIILYVQKPNADLAKTIMEASNKIPKITIYVSNKVLNKTNIIKRVSKISKRDYINYLEGNFQIKKNYTQTLNKLIRLYKTDIIEFGVEIKSPFKQKYKNRMIEKIIFNLSENKMPVAKATPILSNKIISTKILKNLKHRKGSLINTEFSTWESLQSMILAKSYVNINDILLKLNTKLRTGNPMRQIKEIDDLLKISIDDELDFSNELIYQKVFVFATFVWLRASTTKKVKLIKLVEKTYSRFVKENKIFFNTNKYLMLGTKESKAMIKMTSLTNFKKLNKIF
ncbi:MAG: hypothetical protein K4H23_04455 [Mollicutes bacterium PWAP]|nr:hypothetical protein [Mollicutes bacterium PWAP]